MDGARQISPTSGPMPGSTGNKLFRQGRERCGGIWNTGENDPKVRKKNRSLTVKKKKKEERKNILLKGVDVNAHGLMGDLSFVEQRYRLPPDAKRIST